MNKKIQLFISFILLLSCICALIYRINIRRDENERASFKKAIPILHEDEDIDIENTEVYDTFLKNFNCQGEDYFYSYTELVGYEYPILLLSDGTYKNTNGYEVAMWTDIYYPVNSEVILFGKISSTGTAYPISADTTGIFSAGGHEVAKYGLDLQNSKLKLISKYITFFHIVGEEVRAITVEMTGDNSKIVSEEDFNKAYKVYGEANVIYYKPLC